MSKHLGGWVAFALAAAASSSCQEPTQVELRLSTDLPCDGVHGTAVTVGRRGELEAAFPAASLSVCETGADGTQHLGLVVFLPRSENDQDFAFKVVTAVSASSPDQCVPGDGPSRGYQGCIVARRELRYRPGQTLRLEVPMLQQCEGVECTADSTCFDATTCIPAGVTCTNEACTIDEAPEQHFANPAGPGPAAGGSGGHGGAGGQAGDGGEAGASDQAGNGGEAGSGSGASAGNGPGGSGGTGEQGGGGAGGAAPVVSQVVAGLAHSCAIVGNGEVYCWGQNDAGQLGDGTRNGRPFAKPVLQSPGGAPLTGVQALALGNEHSCALLTSGEARCWGGNDFGQLGDGTTTDRLTPVPVLNALGGPPLTGVQALALGNEHSCALLTSGEARCWGWNGSGQLGDGTETDRLTPVPVRVSPGGPSLTGVQDLALGNEHSCARLSTGEASCWGGNYSGQLGDGTTTDRLTPVPVRVSPGGPSLTGVKTLALGTGYSCALRTSGEALCWGSNNYGRLGDGTLSNQPSPVPVLLPPGAVWPLGASPSALPTSIDAPPFGLLSPSRSLFAPFVASRPWGPRPVLP